MSSSRDLQRTGLEVHCALGCGSGIENVFYDGYRHFCEAGVSILVQAVARRHVNRRPRIMVTKEKARIVVLECAYPTILRITQDLVCVIHLWFMVWRQWTCRVTF